VACKLTESTKSGVDFSGKTGDQIQIGVTSDSGGAVIVSAIYNHVHLAAPWMFTLVQGNHRLLVLVDNPVPRDWTTIQEMCNPGTQTLAHFPFDPDGPTEAFNIEAS
jgi:hypothetical protein